MKMVGFFDLRSSAVSISLCLPLLTFGPAYASDLKQDEASKQGADSVTEITVTAQRKDVTTKIDRDIYNVKAGPDAASLTTVDILTKLPGVIVDSSNKVTIHGGVAVSFLIDGKPVKRELAMAIPASQIARVEVITNPSAEYDSSSGAIINIILKKSAALGWKGANSGKIDTLGGYDVGLNVTHGGPKWTFIGSLTFRKIPFRINTQRVTNYDELQDRLYDAQAVDSREDSSFRQITMQSKLIRNFSDEKNLSIVVGVHSNEYPRRVSYVETLSAPGYVQNSAYNRSVRFSGLYPYGSVDYEDKKPDAYDLTSSLEFYSGVDSDGEDIDGSISRTSHAHTAFSFIQGAFNLDKNLNKTDILSTGFNVSGNDVDQLSVLSGYSGAGQTDLDDFSFSRKSYAAYATYQTRAMGLEVKAGLRFERFDQDLSNEQGGISGLKSVSHVLPSLHLSKSLDAHNTVRASFTVRTDVPDAINYNPFRKYDSPYLAEEGNPFLKPASKQQAELSHTYENSPFSFTQTVYYRDTKNDVNTYSFLGGDGVTVVSYANLGTSTAYGYNATIKNTFSKKLQVSYDIDVFHQDISAPATLSDFQSYSYSSLNSNLVLDYALNKQNQMTASITYAGKTYSLGMMNPAAWTSDLKYTRTFNSKLSLTVDVVNAGVPETLITRFYSPGFTGYERTYRASQAIRVGLSKPF